MSADIGPVADELYGLPAAEFTAARDLRAAAAKQAGDRELAAEIKKLRRPTASAWLTNHLVRARADEIATLLRVGDGLRAAQAELAGDELRRLSQEGQKVVLALGREARRLATEAGQAPAEGTVREVEDTLHAALADPAAGEAVRSGRLTTALHYSGFGPVDISGAVAAPAARAAPTPAARAAPTPAKKAAAAKAELTEARAGRVEQERRVSKAWKQRERVTARIAEMEDHLQQLRAQEREAAGELREAERSLRAAERRVAGAEAASGGQTG